MQSFASRYLFRLWCCNHALAIKRRAISVGKNPPPPAQLFPQSLAAFEKYPVGLPVLLRELGLTVNRRCEKYSSESRLMRWGYLQPCFDKRGCIAAPPVTLCVVCRSLATVLKHNSRGLNKAI